MLRILGECFPKEEAHPDQPEGHLLDIHAPLETMTSQARSSYRTHT